MDIVFVILHYMTPEYTKKCVESIQCRLDTKKYKIIIVDNASPDKSGQMLATLYKSSEDVDVVLLEENCGFAKGNNIGIKLSCEKYNPKFVIVTNNDTELLSTNLFSQLCEDYNQNQFSLLGPMICTKDGKCNVNPINEKIVVWLMGSMAFYGIYEGVTQNNPLFLRFFSENALTDYKNSFLYTYNTVGSMEEALIFAMLLSMSSIFILMMGNKRNKYLLYIVFGIAMFFTNKRSALLMWILVYVIYEVLDAWFISNKRTYAVRLFKIMFGIAIGIFILSIVKIKGNTILSLVTGKFTGLFSEDSRSYMQRYGALIIALELILQKNSIFGFLFGNGLSSLVGNFVTNRRTITDLNFYVIDNQYITSWYDSGFVFLILCVFICVHFIIELTKIIVDKHIEISLRKKSLVLLIGMILVMFYSFIIDVLTWYQPIFIISFIIALSNWNIKEAKKECEYTR